MVDVGYPQILAKQQKALQCALGIFHRCREAVPFASDQVLTLLSVHISQVDLAKSWDDCMVIEIMQLCLE